LPHRLLALLIATLASSVVATATAGTLGEYRQLVLNGHQLKWGEPVLRTGATVAYALASGQLLGVWGGTSPEERRVLLGRGRRARVAS